MPTTDIQVSNLKINVLTEEQYEQIQNPSNTELYLVPEVVDTVPTEDSTNTITSGAVYDAIHDITAADVNAIPTSEKGANNGVAELDSNGKVPSSQLPSYVDDVLEYASQSAFPATGESGKIYIALDTNKTYRWGGSAYVEISESLALGETSSTAYRGDRGKTAYDHSQVTDGSNPHNTTFANIASKPTTIAGYGITDAFSGSYNDLTNKPTDATTSSSGFMSASDKVKLNGIESGATKGMYNVLKPEEIVVDSGYITYKYSPVSFSDDDTVDNLILWFESNQVREDTMVDVKVGNAFSHLLGYDKITRITYGDVEDKTFIVTWDDHNSIFYIHKEIITDVSTKYDTDDRAGTIIADSDYFPFYDTSATEKRKSLWSNIKSVLKTYFDTLYQAVIDSSHKLSADLIVDGTTNKVINVKPDWNAASGADAEILNKPTIPAAGIPSGGNAGQVLKKASATDYDVHWANASETLPSAYCTTSGSTAAKKANCSLYVTQTNQYLQVLIGSANTYQGALTLNINSAGAKPIYINGTVSSSSNYTLPNGTYFVFYDGTNYYFRTDGKLPMKDTAFGGSYNDLADKPTIPAAQVNSDWNASSGVAQILNKPTIPSITLTTWTNS